MKSSCTQDGPAIGSSQLSMHRSLVTDQVDYISQEGENKYQELKCTTIKVLQNGSPSISQKGSTQSERLQINTQLNNLLNFNRHTDSLESTTASLKARSVKNSNFSMSAFKPIFTTSARRSNNFKKDLSISIVPSEMNSLRVFCF